MATPVVQHQRASKGFTIIELAVTIAAFAVLGTFAFASYFNFDETRDASLVQAAQANLQAIISQAAVRMDTAPTTLNPTAVQNAVRDTMSGAAILTGATATNYTMSIPNSNRSAGFTVNLNGDVRLNSLTNFTYHGITADGTIHKL